MTKIIAAYPCLGKTTIGNLNRDFVFDREFNESRSTHGMNNKEKEVFFKLCGKIIDLHIKSGFYKYIFVTDDFEILKNISLNPTEITVIFPDAYDKETMLEYKNRVIKRSGEDWFNRVLGKEIENLPQIIDAYKRFGFDVRLIKSGQYIGDIFDFSEEIILP